MLDAGIRWAAGFVLDKVVAWTVCVRWPLQIGNPPVRRIGCSVIIVMDIIQASLRQMVMTTDDSGDNDERPQPYSLKGKADPQFNCLKMRAMKPTQK